MAENASGGTDHGKGNALFVVGLPVKGGYYGSPTDLSGLKDGSHTFSVRATDAAGNVDGSPAAVTWTSDSTPPAASITSPAADAVVSGVVSLGAGRKAARQQRAGSQQDRAQENTRARPCPSARRGHKLSHSEVRAPRSA